MNERSQRKESVNKRPSSLTLVIRLNKNMCSRNLHGYQACCGLNECSCEQMRVFLFSRRDDSMERSKV